MQNESWLENEYPTIVKWGHRSRIPQKPLRVVLSLTGKIRTGNRPELIKYWTQTIKSIKELHNVHLIVTGFTDEMPSYPHWERPRREIDGSWNSKEGQWTKDKSNNVYDLQTEAQRIQEVRDAIPFDYFQTEPGPYMLYPDNIEYNRSYQPIYKFLRSLDPISDYDIVIKARFDNIQKVDPRYDGVSIIKEYFAGNILEMINNPMLTDDSNALVLFDNVSMKNYNRKDFDWNTDIHFSDHRFFMNRRAVDDCRNNIQQVLKESYPVLIYQLAWSRSICQKNTWISSTSIPARLTSHIIRPVGE